MIKIIYIDREETQVEVWVSESLMKDLIIALVSAGCRLMEVKE